MNEHNVQIFLRWLHNAAWIWHKVFLARCPMKAEHEVRLNRTEMGMIIWMCWVKLSLSLHFNGHFLVEPGLAGVY